MDESTETPVKRTYDRIAEHFASTRAYPWPEVTAFLRPDAGDAVSRLDADATDALAGGAAPVVTRSTRDAGGPSSVGLDVGCGNGRHAESLSAVVGRVVGADVSAELLATARQRGENRRTDPRPHLLQADAASLPVCSDAVDVAVYVATLHHLRPRSRRVASLSELSRVLAPDGRALVSAWATAHDRFDADSGFDTTVPWTLPGGESVPRFYHIYDPTEFAADIRDSGLVVVGTAVSSGNCYAVVEPGE
ncbi:S-adenosylmethionine-dependent methyltransferase [Halobellus salinus]|uniref:S-adenosylmethionine-dependent methyltransferase n=1 Tax=Halobellus salinus TaxID=931585 RepID=A0A830E8D2_9EURY|nr:class I SAM-dependent methyltransferase [Halobellus salinus]GGJ00110.1 S-adenosylmethionine-dependent methyltransferase [Halobellus salinus]SMP01921.1 Ubiquinone/menaquinone biosynthesis C-methylase UbiE [Halobellus salinus]